MTEIKLPLPIRYEGKTFDTIETKQILTSVIADTNRVVQSGDIYKAIQTFIAGGSEKIGDITDKVLISNVCGHLPFKSAWVVATKMIMVDEKDDGVEGIYTCPRCGEKKVCEFNEDSEMDTRDFISDLKVKYIGNEPNPFKFKLESPVGIKDEDGVEEFIEDIEIEYPTLNHCSQAFGKIGDKDEIRLQLAVYVEALKKANGHELDRKFKTSFGMLIFERMSRTDIRRLSEMFDQFGLVTKIKKVCRKCGKEWMAEINTANFFGSALR